MRSFSMVRSLVTLCLVVGAFGCGPAPRTSADVPPPANGPPPAPAKGAVSFVVEGDLLREDLPAQMPALKLIARKLPAPPKGLPPADKKCTAYAKRAPQAAACGSRDDALTSLANAIATTDAANRDALLAGLEGCAQLPPAMARALRAELAPPECGDIIATSVANAPPAGTSGAVHDALVGLALAGMLSRAATQPPKMTGKATKASVEKFINTKMGPWVRQHAVAIEQLAALGSKLRYYGRAIVAVEAGMADMRFIDAVRTVPVPEEFVNDEELREAHLQGREQALEPRKLRGRDAALVGLGSLATVGVLRDPRVDRARSLLSRMFGGRPINALDTLLLPPLAPVEATGSEQRLAARLQTFYAGLVFPADEATDAGLLRMLIERGLSLPHRIALRKAESALGDDVRLLSARARLELGQNYWRRVDFDEATRLLVKNQSKSADARLILAVALALRGGHANAADMMIKAPISDLGIGDVKALDAVASGKQAPHAGMAAFDAALIKQLAAPASAPESYWRDLHERFENARGMLQDIRHQKIAEERALEAKETADAVAKMQTN